jgi:hypothetical protein
MFYVAYGSNMNLEQMNYRCPHSKVVGNGKLIGWKLVFNYHADVIRTKSISDEVPVVIWDIHKNDWDMLDMYEGYPSYYVKRNVEVVTENNEIVNAVVYVMADDKKGIFPPANGYFKGIEDGYISNGIDTKCLYDALKRSQKEMM